MRSIFYGAALALFATFVGFDGARAQSPDVAAAADRLLEVQSPKEMLADIAGKISVSLPPSQRQAYVDAMTEPAFVERFKVAARDALAKNFTVEELDALAEFYQRPVARSAMAKMGDYMASLMPFIQAELIGIASKLQSQP
ncbi:hypothetical protein W911_02370 [Hyphomicrobium nitrativorans NL23]|uniref:DUF2059 domain-containing protein n=1 Tax=Hyphomicrobium nitrativorans NL23 TaxID=1029756 RepID=V5SAQ4_9HYPH|nr:DUF2059 domain-containing protein [Hyphomicrobium nitrativorans]AHB47512.1 hypothetical protein W911_02370 [Hyphomicrobium nitrativorans NL23]